MGTSFSLEEVRQPGAEIRRHGPGGCRKGPSLQHPIPTGSLAYNRTPYNAFNLDCPLFCITLRKC
eukprot:8252656-Pyramimonas_sp.AAC.1